MKRRRQLSLAVGLISLAAPLAGWTQSAGRMRRIGALSLGNPASEAVQQVRRQFLESLRRAGYEEGKNVVIEWRFAEGDEARLAGLADELVRLDVEVIVASLNYAIAAAKRATRTIPTVMYGAAFPVELGFVQSLARPGGNITGTTWSRPEDVPATLDRIAASRPDALFVAVDSVVGSQLREIATFALQQKLLSIGTST